MKIHPISGRKRKYFIRNILDISWAFGSSELKSVNNQSVYQVTTVSGWEKTQTCSSQPKAGVYMLDTCEMLLENYEPSQPTQMLFSSGYSPVEINKYITYARLGMGGTRGALKFFLIESIQLYVCQQRIESQSGQFVLGLCVPNLVFLINIHM